MKDINMKGINMKGITSLRGKEVEILSIEVKEG